VTPQKLTLTSLLVKVALQPKHFGALRSLPRNHLLSRSACTSTL
jgi:hypothetical protein